MRYWLIILYTASLPCFAIELPDIGNSFGTLLTPTEEDQLGAAFMRELRQQVTIIDDVEVNQYVNELGRKLVAYSNEPQQRFHFFVIDDEQVNAFAVPGGYIALYSGLILKTQSESELASVIAHEISHVTQHHSVRTIESMSKFSFPMMATLLAAIVLGSKNPELAQAAITTTIAGAQQLEINFTREHEKEADRLGMQILHDSGFDPYDMPKFFEQLQSISRYYQTIPEFLRTHPMSTDRAAEAYSRAEQYPKSNLHKDSPYYHLMRAKILTILDKEPPHLVQKLQTMLQEKRFRDERATRYALALALLANKQVDQVQAQIDWLLQHDGDRVVYRSLSAQLALAQKNTQAAMQQYSQALLVYPNNQKLSLEYAELLVQNQQAEKAKALLLILPTDDNPNYYFLLARTYKATGELPDSYLTMAKYYDLNGQTALAVEQLKLARKLDNLSFYMATRIEARYRELQKQLLEEKEQEN